MNRLKYILIFTAVITAIQTSAQTAVLHKVFKKYGGKWPKTLSFTQTTTLFTAKGEVRQTWYEAGSLPDYFRIDFDRAKGNSIIFNGDQEYYFRENKLARTGKNNNPLIYILGGMYFHHLDTAKSKLTKIGVNCQKESTGEWNGKKVLIVGAEQGDTTSTQLWFDAKELFLVRFIENDPAAKMDIHFAGHQKIGNTWHETIVDIFRNGKIMQKEEYSEFKTNIKLDPAIFEPSSFGKVHWLD